MSIIFDFSYPELRCHDTSLYRLLSLLGVYADENRMDVIIPMAANLQMIFYKNAQGNVLVKFLHNEREIRLPFANNVYYDWKKLKDTINKNICNYD